MEKRGTTPFFHHDTGVAPFSAWRPIKNPTPEADAHDQMVQGIAGYSASTSYARYAQGGSVAVAAKAQDAAEQQGRAAVGLIETAGRVGREQAPRQAAPDGTGGVLDVKA